MLVGSHPKVSYGDATFRTGYDYTNMCAMCEYVFFDCNRQCKVGRALQNYPNPENWIKCPNLDGVYAESQQLLHNFILELFGINQEHEYLGPNKPMWLFVERSAATFFMYYEELKNDLEKGLRPSAVS